MFQWKLYLAMALFIAAFITFNYSIDFEDSVIDHITNFWLRLLTYSLTSAVAFWGSILIIVLFTGKKEILQSRSFWIKSLLGFIFLGLYRTINFREFAQLIADHRDQVYFISRVSRAILKIVLIAAPLYLLYLIYDKKHLNTFYGVTFKKSSFTVYGKMLLIMLVLIFVASFFDSITDYYPMIKRSGMAKYLLVSDTPKWLAIGMFESTYALGFVAVELFFRGFLVLAFARLVGPNIILAMIATYAVLHFGKPMTETISSVFGGYILGIFALKTKNIWGGIFIHGGVALLMELFASLQLYVFK